MISWSGLCNDWARPPAAADAIDPKKVRALYDNPGTPGEKAAAKEALKRMGAWKEPTGAKARAPSGATESHPSMRVRHQHLSEYGFKMSAKTVSSEKGKSSQSYVRDASNGLGENSRHVVHLQGSGGWEHRKKAENPSASGGYDPEKVVGSGVGPDTLRSHLSEHFTKE